VLTSSCPALRLTPAQGIGGCHHLQVSARVTVRSSMAWSQSAHLRSTMMRFQHLPPAVAKRPARNSVCGMCPCSWPALQLTPALGIRGCHHLRVYAGTQVSTSKAWPLSLHNKRGNVQLQHFSEARRRICIVGARWPGDPGLRLRRVHKKLSSTPAHPCTGRWGLPSSAGLCKDTVHSSMAWSQSAHPVPSCGHLIPSCALCNSFAR